MKKLIFLAFLVLLINGFAQAQTTKVLCDDCRQFPFRPIGCDHTNCLAQLLSTTSRDQLINTLLLPGNVADKIIHTRNIAGVQGLEEYKAVLEPEEYKRLLNAYDMYVQDYTPHVVKKEQQVKDFAPTIYFDVNKAVIAEPYYKVLRQSTETLKQDPHLNVTIIGGADNTGSETGNRSIALARATAVKKYLVSHGVAAARISIVGHNQAANDNTGDRAAYRYVKMETSR